MANKNIILIDEPYLLKLLKSQFDSFDHCVLIEHLIN